MNRHCRPNRGTPYGTCYVPVIDSLVVVSRGEAMSCCLTFDHGHGEFAEPVPTRMVSYEQAIHVQKLACLPGRELRGDGRIPHESSGVRGANEASQT